MNIETRLEHRGYLILIGVIEALTKRICKEQTGDGATLYEVCALWERFQGLTTVRSCGASDKVRPEAASGRFRRRSVREAQSSARLTCLNNP